MIRLLGLLALCTLWVACDSDEPRPRGLLGPDGKPLPVDVTATPPPPKTRPEPAAKKRPVTRIRRAGSAPRRRPETSSAEAAMAAMRNPAGATAAQAATPAERTGAPAQPVPTGMTLKQAQKRLGELVGEPRTCLNLARVADELGGKVGIRVSASVMGSGRITRAEANVQGHPSEAGLCVANRVADRMLGPVQGAPITVTAEVQVVVERTRAPKAPSE